MREKVIILDIHIYDIRYRYIYIIYRHLKKSELVQFLKSF